MPLTQTFIPDLLTHHLDELGFIFGQWRSALGDPDHTLASVGELEERIRAHLDGVRVPRDAALPFLMDALAGEDADLVFAAGYALCTWPGEPRAPDVVAAFEAAEPDALEPLKLALAYGLPPADSLARLRKQLAGDSPERAVAAAEVLGFCGALELSGAQLRYFLEHEDAGVRAGAWRLAGLLGAAVPAKAYAAGLKDEDLAVRHAALEAGAWCGEAGVLPALRLLSESADPESLPALRLLAVLAGPGDLPLMLGIARTVDLGPERFDVVAACGHPSLIEPLIASLADEDPATAGAAGTAFAAITGVDVESNETATERPPGGEEPDEFEAEFLEEVVLPDPALAREAWSRLQPTLGSAQRLSRGLDVGGPINGADFHTLDMRARRDLYLRSRFAGGWTGTAIQLETFPQAPSG